MILGDEFAGHRKWWDPDWIDEESGIDTTKWTDWDFSLLRAYQIIEDYTKKSNGQLAWMDESPEVDWEVKSSFSGHDEALERAHEKRDKLKPGEMLYAVPVLRNPDDPPSMSKWVEDLENDRAQPMPANAPQGGRPPTPEELAQIKAGKLG